MRLLYVRGPKKGLPVKIGDTHRVKGNAGGASETHTWKITSINPYKREVEMLDTSRWGGEYLFEGDKVKEFKAGWVEDGPRAYGLNFGMADIPEAFKAAHRFRWRIKGKDGLMVLAGITNDGLQKENMLKQASNGRRDLKVVERWVKEPGHLTTRWYGIYAG